MSKRLYTEKISVSFSKMKKPLTWAVLCYGDPFIFKDIFIKSHGQIYFIDGLIKAIKRHLKLPALPIIIDKYRYVCIKFDNEADEAMFIISHANSKKSMVVAFDTYYVDNDSEIIDARHSEILDN